MADATCMKRVAQRIVDARKEGHPVVAVVSARGATTDELIEMAEEISENPPAREMDMLLSDRRTYLGRPGGDGHPRTRL